MYAAQDGHISVVELLLAHHAQVDSQDHVSEVNSVGKIHVMMLAPFVLSG